MTDTSDTQTAAVHQNGAVMQTSGGAKAASKPKPSRLTNKTLPDTETQEAPAFDMVVRCPVTAGRRRAGAHWPAGETPFNSADFTEEQMAQLKQDPVLAVYPFTSPASE